MLLSTTSTIDGRRVLSYHGLVTGEAILGANVFRDLFAGIRDPKHKRQRFPGFVQRD